MEREQSLSKLVEGISPASLAAYIQSLGFHYDKPWGPYLARYRRISDGDSQDLIVPTDNEIDDFSIRTSEAILKLGSYLELEFDQILRAIDLSGFDIIRIRTNPNSTVSSIEFDYAIDLLNNGLNLVESSAVVVTNGPTREIRGRRPDIVRDYVDTVRMGQTEVGSFVLTLLLPIETPGMNYGLPDELMTGFGRKVSSKFSSILKAVDRLTDVQSNAALEQAVNEGLSSNFSSALADMLRITDNLSLNVATCDSELRHKKARVVRFGREDQKTLVDIASQLSVPRIRRPTTIVGTVTAIREPSLRRPGSVNVLCEIEGESHTVTLKFNRDDRPKIIRAFERKAELSLQVSGTLTRAGPKYVLEGANDFKTPRSGELA